MSVSIGAGVNAERSEVEIQNIAMEFDAERRMFVPVERAIDALQEGQVLVRVTCCTICGSDLHTFTGRRAGHHRGVLGHEIIGDIVGWCGEFSPMDYHGQPLRVGQRVTWAMSVGCECCFFCDNDLNQKCDSLFKYGHEANEGHPTGGLSQHCVLIAGTPVFPIPDSLSDAVAAPVNCATATVSAAMRLVRQTQRLHDSAGLIVGAGMLGLTAAAQLHEAGAKQIVVLDPDEGRASLANDFGATEVIHDTDPAHLEQRIMDLTDGRGVDFAIDFAGMTSAVESCLHSVRLGGVTLLVGSVFPSESIEVYPESIVRRMLTIRGLHNYLPKDLEHALAFLDRNVNRFPFDSLVSRTFPLSQTQDAFYYASDQRPVRVAVVPDSL
ncbi:zinc-binding dehydrogenase [Rhodopirellula sp. JC740]|uniref:alcohol dehydrogenase n=1 Tax=Rhodopirellula halodulae TaxID=2894198 RepID=A0ABS8NIY9_9BACT|nr:zinc-binding dehydrogenase [Rhodopirellula sp. JC740]